MEYEIRLVVSASTSRWIDVQRSIVNTLLNHSEVITGVIEIKVEKLEKKGEDA